MLYYLITSGNKEFKFNDLVDFEMIPVVDIINNDDIVVSDELEKKIYFY